MRSAAEHNLVALVLGVPKVCHLCGAFAVDYNNDFKLLHDKCEGLTEFNTENYFSDYILSSKGISFASPQFMK